PITPALLAPAIDRLRLSPCGILLLATGWSAHWGSDGYPAHPWLTPDAAEALVEAGIRTVAVDALSVDPTPPPGEPVTGWDLPAHRVLCGAGGAVAENLRGLERLVGARDVEVFLFPLRLPGADGAPVRAVARVNSG
ncbi:cyclase family protein, partial [Streptomyces carpinensis]